MFFALAGIVLGLLLGLFILRFTPPRLLGWLVLGLGLLAFVFILPVFIAILRATDTSFTPLASIPLGLACLISGLGALRKNDRTWRIWLALALTAIPLIFWLIFALGEILYPH